MRFHDFHHIDIFQDLNEEELARPMDARTLTLAEGEHFFREGDAQRLFFIVLEGALQIYRVIQNQQLPINRFSAGMSGGEVPLLSGAPHLANAVALSPVTLLVFEEDAFWCMMGEFPTVRSRVLANMAVRMPELQQLSAQREKLVSLGTLAAGLAHELNNPAAAAARSARRLVETLENFGALSSLLWSNLCFRTPSSEDAASGKGIFAELVAQIQPEGVRLSTLEQAEREDELGDWLESLHIPQAWDAAATLVVAGLTRSRLEEFAAALQPEYVSHFIRWLAMEVEMRTLAAEMGESTRRIAELVSAMKSYSYMDQARAKSAVDIHQGLDTTLTILRHKLQAKEIGVVKHYQADLPPVLGHGGELNQVWTNILDNAIDAVPTGGQIEIETAVDACDPAMVTVAIIDNGPGISTEVKSRIFDPFFTTKKVGKGTGLGLEIVQRIVVNQHEGSMTVDSEPGHTRFQICLPICTEERLGPVETEIADAV